MNIGLKFTASRLSIRWMLTGLSAFALLGALLLGSTAIWQARNGAAQIDQVQTEAVVPMIMLQSLEKHLKEIGYRVSGVVLEILPTQGSYVHLQDMRATLQVEWAGFIAVARPESLGKDDREQFDKADKGMAELDARLEKLARAYQNDDTDTIQAFLEDDWLDIYGGLIKPVEALSPVYQHQVSVIFDRAQIIATQALWIVIAAMIVVVLVVSLAGYFLGRRILARVKSSREVVDAISHFDFERELEITGEDELSALQKDLVGMQSHLRLAIAEVNTVVGAIAHGDFGRRIEGQYEGSLQTMKLGVNAAAERVGFMMDELGKVMSALEAGHFEVQMDQRVEGDFRARVDRALASLALVMHAINQVMNQVAEGQFNVRVEVEARGELAVLKQNLNDSLEKLESAILAVSQEAERVAEGDLVARVEGSYAGELANLQNSLNAGLGNMEAAVSEVMQATHIVQNVAGEIAQGSRELMDRTANQAASIEETAASMETLAATVRKNAENARTADRLASEARDESEQGAVVMRDSGKAMDAMRDAARRIEEIVGLIDGIAFQTNILALNAAVEAARAGEHGRGFAVVANEVRFLAQKSAQAAKDIKVLIAATASRIDDGARLMEDSGQLLDRIHEAVRRVSQVVAEIASASVEQSNGIAQISAAVSGMDRTTQANSGLEEETAAAAENLRLQSEELKRLTGRFTVSDTASETWLVQRG